MSYDDDDFVVSDDEEEMSPDSLQKESPIAMKQEASLKEKTASSTVEDSESFDMTDFETDSTDVTTSTINENAGTSREMPPPGSIESVIRQVTTASTPPAPAKSASSGKMIKKEASNDKMLKKQSSTSSVQSRNKETSSTNLMKKNSSVSNIGKKGSFQKEKSVKKGLGTEDRSCSLTKQSSSSSSSTDNKSRQSSFSSSNTKKKDQSSTKSEVDGGNDSRGINQDEIAPVGLKDQDSSALEQSASFDMDDFEADDTTADVTVDTAAVSNTVADTPKIVPPPGTDTLTKSKSASFKKENSSKRVERNMSNKRMSSNRNLKQEFSDVKGGKSSSQKVSSPPKKLPEQQKSSPKPQKVESPSAQKSNKEEAEEEVDDDVYDDANDFEEEETGGQSTQDEATARGKSLDVANSAVDTPQKSHQAPEASVSSPPRKGKVKKEKNEVDYKNKIHELDRQIREIAAEREKYSPVKKLARSKLPKVKSKKGNQPPKSSNGTGKKKFVHSKLKYIMADMSVSPYMTAPNVRYSKETLHLPEIIRSAKFEESCKVLPFDEKEMEDKFINEVYNYKNTDIY